MADDKVVIGSTGGTPVKPGDLTRITSVGKVDLNDTEATATIPRIVPRINPRANPTSDSVETSTINREEIRAKLEEDKPKKSTIKLKPVVVKEGGEGGETATVPLQAAAPRIITATAPAPAPVPAQATAVPKFASGPEPEEDETVKIQKPRAVNASTALPGVKQTIKLRPSSTTPAPMSGSESNAAIIPPAAPAAPQPQTPQPTVAAGSEAKRTIRLVPKKSDATSGGDQVVASAKPSAPTVKLEEPPAPPAPAEPVRSAVTVKLPSAETGDAAAPKRTLKLKSSRAPEPSTPAAPPVPAATIPNSPAIASATDAEMPAIAREDREIPLDMAQKESASAGKQEPSIIFTIAACFAFFVMAYFTWMLVGQYCNNYMDSKISVPGLSGKVK